MADVVADAGSDALPQIVYEIADRSLPMPSTRLYYNGFTPHKYRWVGHPWVLKAWYDNANRLRDPGFASPWDDKSIFREYARRDPTRCHPTTPMLLDYSPIEFEQYELCEVKIHVHPGGPEHAHLNTVVMKLHRRDESAPLGFEAAPYWMSIADPKFKLHLGPSIFANNHVPETLLLAADALQLAGMDLFPATPIVQPTKILWAKVRWAVAVRPYIKHWLEDYAVRNSAPGRRFHLEGVAGFENTFVS